MHVSGTFEQIKPGSTSWTGFSRYFDVRFFYILLSSLRIVLHSIPVVFLLIYLLFHMTNFHTTTFTRAYCDLFCFANVQLVTSKYISHCRWRHTAIPSFKQPGRISCFVFYKGKSSGSFTVVLAMAKPKHPPWHEFFTNAITSDSMSHICLITHLLLKKIFWYNYSV